MQEEAAERAQDHHTVQTSYGFHTSNATSSFFLGGQQQRSRTLPNQSPASVEQNQSPNTLAKQPRPVNTTPGDLANSVGSEDAVNSGRDLGNDTASLGPSLQEADKATESASRNRHHGAAEQILTQDPPHKRPRLDTLSQMPSATPSEGQGTPLFTFTSTSTSTSTAYTPSVPATATSPPLATPTSSSLQPVSGPGIYYHGQRPHPPSSANGSTYKLLQEHASAQASIPRRRPSSSSNSSSISQIPANQTDAITHSGRWQQESVQTRRRISVPGGQPQTVQQPIPAQHTSTSMLLPRLEAIMVDPQTRHMFKNWSRQRVVLLEDACHCEDWFYLTFHQIYCWQTINRAAVGQLGITGTREMQLANLETILLPNTQLHHLVLEWFSQFPTNQAALLTGSSSDAHNTLQLIHIFLDKMSLNWSQFYSSCLVRKYPPSPYELYERLGISSTVLQVVFFTFIIRQIAGGDDKGWTKRVIQFFKFTQSQLIDKLHRINQGLPEVPPNNDTDLVQFASEYYALRGKHTTGPVLMSDATSVQRAVQAPATTFTRQNPPPTPTMFAPRPQPPAMYSNNQMPPAVALPTVQSGISSGLNASVATNPQQRPASPSNASSSNPSISSMGPRQQDFVQEMTGVNPVRGTPVAARLQMALASPNSPAPSTGRRRRPGNFSANPNGITEASSNQVSLARQTDSLSQKTAHLVPPAGKMMSLSTNPNPDLVGLHQSRLLSPEPAVPELPRASTRLFQVLQRFVLAPQLMTNQQSYYRWQFNIPAADSSRKANDMLVQEPVNRPAPKVRRVFKQGSLVYRLRCIKLNSGLNESDWSTAATYWPSTCFISLNTYEIEVRRKSHWGKNLPCDLTRIVKTGMNDIELSVNLGPDEYTSTFAIAVEKIEVLDQSQCTKQVTLVEKYDSLAAIIASLAASQNDDDVAIVDPHISIDLIDPFTAQVWKIPVRGKTCAHRECFDLQAFLESRPNKHKGVPLSSADDWKCPICNKDARPQRLVLDEFLLSVGKQLQEQSSEGHEVRSIQVTPDGIWKAAKVEKKRPQQRDVDGQNGPARATSARSTPSVNATKETVMREANMEPAEIIALDDD